jgi:Mg2+-importing ATPase
MITTIALPYLPLGAIFEFVPLPPAIMAAILGIALAYAVVSEMTKRIFFRRFGHQRR